jgi:hypothetical protein
MTVCVHDAGVDTCSGKMRAQPPSADVNRNASPGPADEGESVQLDPRRLAEDRRRPVVILLNGCWVLLRR